jgi:hypothetical protein
VACDEALANEAAAAAQAIRDDCENDLAEAIPALQVSPLNTKVVIEQFYLKSFVCFVSPILNTQNHYNLSH